jgi:hypothetical protein
MSSKNWITGVIIVVAMAGAALGVYGQEVVPRAMTTEDIMKELKSVPPMKGEILHDGKVVCAFDSEKAQSMPEGPLFPQPAKRVQTGKSPKLVIKLSRGDDPKRLLLVKSGAMDSKIQMTLASTPKEPSQYTVSFDKPLEAGNYEFAIMEGQLVLWLRCGLTVTE